MKRVKEDIEIFYILYKTTNIVNGKEYIGIHKTNTLDDGYIGNGIYSQKNAEYKTNTPFRRAVVKHGYNNFKREIIKFCNSYDELLEEEEKVVTYEYINQKNTYNACTGGKNPLNPNAGANFDIINNEGVRYTGKNISELCRKLGITNYGISGLMLGKYKYVKGFQKASNFSSKSFIIVNLETEDVYQTYDINNWCRENAPELSKPKGNNLLTDIIKGKAKLALKKWWVCNEKDWKGIEYLFKNDPRSKNYKVVDNCGNVHHIENVNYFCKIYEILPESLYRLLRGKQKQCRNFKLYID